MFEVSSKSKVVVVDLSPTLQPKHIEGLNDFLDDDIETEQLEFSPKKPKLASLRLGLFVKSLKATK
ncbi:hypothetical protein PVK06_047359 [Gossypium arboreum]|uniref:Uncharacterized protein n=1 Tax=Gossypium arboreum TaxID=29729 RepID=A0ABR0MD16_GOSAR|nr:hypothetical protein PVK06_047359 [Gossypium arboreum]